MNREQAINYLICRGFTNEQVGDVVRALTYEPTTKNDLGVEEVTALAEWIEKLTKECEEAYNKGYADGMKAQDKNCSDCEIVQACVEAGIRSTSKALSILDKIRAEIEKLRPNLRPEQMTDYDYAMVNVVNDIVAIIDKYKAESEKA